DQFPDVVQAIRTHVNTRSAILDCEVVGFDARTRTYKPFQHISQRIRRKYDIHRLIQELPVEVNVFDILYHDGISTIEKPFHERRKLVTSLIEPKERVIVPSRIMITENQEDANKFYQESLDAGNEGVMMKSIDAKYKPGSRVGFMVKVKPIMETLDLVVTEATWGEGKRSDWLTSFLVGCIDMDGNFLTVGKVSTGFKELTSDETDQTTFQDMTEMLKPLIISENGKTVTVKPEVVVEVAYEEIQKSPTYSSGYALRFPRFIRLREREPSEISTLDFVDQLYDEQH
ncbi:MAG: ATP-dependent DNA ligase, partial [Nanoarchaeota archaeon]